MKAVLIIALSIFISVPSYSQQKTDGATDDWQLIYANDEMGNRLDGDIHKLISFIRNGKPIRIGWTIEHPTNKSIKVEHFADAKFITIMSDNIVFAQIDPIVGQAPSIKDKFITLMENAEWSFIASTLGSNDSMNVNTTTGALIDHNPWKCGIRWFVKV